MDQNHGFPKLKAAAFDLKNRTNDLSDDELRRLLCHDCDFFGDEHDDELECSCFRLLKILLKGGRFTPQMLEVAVNASAHEAKR